MNFNLDGYYIVALIFGILAVLDCFLGYLFPKRGLTLLFKLLFDVFSVINLLFAYLSTKEAGLIAGLATNVIGICRDLVFLQRGKSKIFDDVTWLAIFLLLYSLSLITTYKNPLSLLPVIGSLINTTALFLYSQKLNRILTIFGQLFFISFYASLIVNSELLTLLNLLCSCVTLVSVILGLINVLRFEKKKSVTNVNNKL